jgi:hypothetical protein
MPFLTDGIKDKEVLHIEEIKLNGKDKPENADP